LSISPQNKFRLAEFQHVDGHATSRLAQPSIVCPDFRTTMMKSRSKVQGIWGFQSMASSQLQSPVKYPIASQ
jgi:hypothetical protein